MSLLLLFGRRANTLAVSETVSLADSVTKQASPVKAETFAVVDVLLRQAGKAATDAFALIDASITRSIARSFGDAFTLFESAFKALGRSVADLFTVSDSIRRNPVKVAIDALTVSDAVTRQSSKNASDSVALVETFAKSTKRNLADALALLDSWAKTFWSGAARRFTPTLLARIWQASTQPLQVIFATVLARVWSATETMIYADPKDPESVEDFQINWSAVLGTDTIVSSAWEVPSPLTLVSSMNTTTLATVRLSGGVAGQNYLLKNVVTCASGRVLPQALMLPVAV